MALSVFVACLPVAVAAPAADAVELLFEGRWSRGGYSIEGGWSVVEDEGGRFVVLDRDFRTRRAPDLKVFLSPLPLADIEDGNATAGALLVAPLERHQGEQRYPIADDVDLEAYRSIIIHCQRFSKYWGGAVLARFDADRPSDAESRPVE